MNSNAIRLHEARTAGKFDDSKIGRGGQFKQIIVGKEGNYKNENVSTRSKRMKK